MINRLRLYKGQSLLQKYYPLRDFSVLSSGDKFYEYYLKTGQYLFSKLERDTHKNLITETSVLLETSGSVIVEQFHTTSRNIISVELDKEGWLTDTVSHVHNKGLIKGFSTPTGKEQGKLIRSAIEFLPYSEKAIQFFNAFDNGYVGDLYGHMEPAVEKAQQVLKLGITPKAKR